MTAIRRLPALVVALAALSLTGCDLALLGSPRPAASVPPVIAPPSAAQTPPTAKPAKKKKKADKPSPVLRAKSFKQFGTLVVDARGLTLYRSERDRVRPSKSRCVGKCAKTWWPATVTSPDQVQVAGIDPDLVGTLRRPDGRLQLTLAGRPLYRFAKDKKPGDVKGNCRDNVFFAVTPEGRKTSMTTRTA